MADNVNVLSTVFTVIAFMDDGSPAPSARAADFLLAHWSLQNNTAADFQLTFFNGSLFTCELCQIDGTVVWSHPGQDPAPDETKTVPVGEAFEVPKDEEPDEKKIPRIPLKQIIADNGIAPGVDLVVKFIPLALGLANVNSVSLWR